MTDDDHKQVPGTVRELGIAFDGFRQLTDEKLSNMSSAMERLAKALEDSNSNKADKADVEDHEKRLRVVETQNQQLKGALALVAFIGTVVSILLGIWQFVSN